MFVSAVLVMRLTARSGVVLDLFAKQAAVAHSQEALIETERFGASIEFGLTDARLVRDELFRVDDDLSLAAEVFRDRLDDDAFEAGGGGLLNPPHLHEAGLTSRTVGGR